MMYGKYGIPPLSHHVFVTVLPVLLVISISVFSPISTVSALTTKKNYDKEPTEYRAVPLLYPSSGEYNPFDPRDVLKFGQHHQEHTFRKRPIFLEETEKSKHITTKSIPLIITSSTSTPKASPNSNCLWAGKNCAESPQDLAAYLSTLNSRPSRFGHKLGKPNDENEAISFGEHKILSSTLPFTVTTNKKPDAFSLFPTKTRKTRTTTPSSDPSWVKLKPVPSRSYDPFSLSKNGSNETDSALLPMASRSGIELNPESFAERHGWKDGKYSGPGGSKVPPWLEELNYQHGGYGENNRRNGYEPDRSGYYDREDENRWIKLEAVPVSGVKISKWVPKNTAPSDLPSTNWKYPSKPPAWWDRSDNFDSAPQRPGNSRPWPARYPQQQKPHTHTSSDSWSDVIYPNNNPVSATASWVSDNKAPGLHKAPPGSRYPTDSWSANGNSHRLGSRPGKPPSNYPDADSSKDEQQWVLISSSKNTQSSSPNNQKYPNYPDFPYPYNQRNSKRINFTKLDKVETGLVKPNQPAMTQDELFRRTNATLHSLRPVLTHNTNTRDRVTTTDKPPLTQSLLDMLTSTGANIVESSTTKYSNIGIGRTTSKREATESPQQPPPTRTKRLMDSGPTYATTMAGIIPGSFGSAIPLIFGRRRRAAFAYPLNPALPDYYLRTRSGIIPFNLQMR